MRKRGAPLLLSHTPSWHVCVIQYKNNLLFAVNILPYILTQNMAPEAWGVAEGEGGVMQETVICLGPSRLVLQKYFKLTGRVHLSWSSKNPTHKA
jgi:hypothetical protein